MGTLCMLGGGSCSTKTAGVEVDLGIENHGPIANDPSFLDAVFASLPILAGAHARYGQLLWFGFVLGGFYELIDRGTVLCACHTHLKVH